MQENSKERGSSVTRLLGTRRVEAGPSGLASPPVRVVTSYKAVNYWEEQGWKLTRANDQLNGYFRTMHESFIGRVDLDETGDHRYFVKDPPPGLARHPHGPCFMHHGNGWYWVHFNVKPRNVDAGLVAIEIILREAIEQYS